MKLQRWLPCLDWAATYDRVTAGKDGLAAVIVTLMSLSWGAVAGTFMAPFLYGLYWKGATRTGIAAGMGTGLVLSISLFFILGPNNSPIPSTLAMIAPFLVIPLVSIWTRKPDQALLAKAFDGIGRKR